MRRRTERAGSLAAGHPLERGTAIVPFVACALALLLTTAPPALAATSASSAANASATRDLGGGLLGAIRDGAFVLLVRLDSGDGWQTACRRACGDQRSWRVLRDANGGEAAAPLRVGATLVVPPELWPEGAGFKVARAFFPHDAWKEGGWNHRVTSASVMGHAESPWTVAALFAGSGRLHERLEVRGKRAPTTLHPGDVVRIDAALVLARLRPASSGAGPTSAPVPLVALAPQGAAIPAVPMSASAPVASVLAASSALPVTPAPEPTEPHAAATLSGDAMTEPTAEAGVINLLTRPVGAEDGATSAVPTTIDETSPAAGVLSEAPSATAPATTALETHEPASPVATAPATTSSHDGLDDGEPAATAAPSRIDRFAVVPGSRSDDRVLDYGRDAEGSFALYRLTHGETLYTHVVLRFTGLVSGRDVNEAARRFARRSGIRDVTEIPAGKGIRIPLEDLLPEHLPPGHPRRLAAERERAESERLALVEPRRDLEGVHVLVDSGHGGSDPGAMNGLAWEDDHVYDIACRVMAALRDRTLATVQPLVQDRSTGHAPLSRIVRDTDEELLTTPPLRLDGGATTRVAVNMRWLLANDMRRQLLRAGVPDARIVFVSFHADSLHESATGAMAYYAAAQMRLPSCGVPADCAQTGCREAEARNGFQMGTREMMRCEGLSRRLGETVIDAIGRRGLGVHDFSPVRGSIVRGGAMVPAVLRYNRASTAILVEVCNLNNPQDQLRLRDPVFRQDFADAVVDGLVDYFDGGARASGGRRAAVIP